MKIVVKTTLVCVIVLSLCMTAVFMVPSSDAILSYESDNNEPIGPFLADGSFYDARSDPVSESTDDDFVAEVDGTKYTALQAAMDAADDGDIVKILRDITLTPESGSDVGAYIKAGVTIDGTNPSGGVFTISTDTAMKLFRTDESDFNSPLVVQNLNLNNTSGITNSRCLDTRGLSSGLVIENVSMTASSGSNTQPLTIGGNTSETLEVTIRNSEITSSDSGYCIITFNRVDMTITDTELNGWTALYMKGPNSSAGSNGSSVNITDSKIETVNAFGGSTNDFGTITCEDVNISITLTGVDVYVAETEGSRQTLFLTSSWATGTGTNSFRIDGDSKVEFRGSNVGILASNKSEIESDCLVTGGTFINVDSEELKEYIPSDLAVNIGDDGSVSVAEPDSNVVYGITSTDFLALGKMENGTLVFDLDRNYRITDYGSLVYFDRIENQSYSSITINGNDYILQGNLRFDSVMNDGDTQSYSIVINDLNIDGTYGDDSWSYAIAIQNQNPAKDDSHPRLINFTMNGGSVSNCDAKGIYITTATSVTISDVDITNCATSPNYTGAYYTKGDYAIDIDITGINGATVDISNVIFSGNTGAVAALKIAQRGGAGDDPSTCGEATIAGVTLNGLDFSDSQAPTDIILGSEPSTPSSDPVEDEIRDYNSAFPVDLTANGETSLSVWGADRQPDNGNNLRLDLTDGSRVKTTGQKDDENGSISIELVSGSARVSGKLLPSMHLTADEEAVTFGDFEDLSGGNLDLIAPEPDYPPIIWDDDDDYVPPIVPAQPSDSGDDNTVTVVACAAAAVVAALMAAFLILDRKR